MAFENLKLTYHWSEYGFQNKNGVPYNDDTVFTGEEAYEMLCRFIEADRLAWNDRLFGTGYWKTKFSLDYQDVHIASDRVDLGDMEFGYHDSVAYSLWHYIKPRLDEDDIETPYLNFIASLKMEEHDYLPNHPELRKMLNTEPITYLYAVDPQSWDNIDKNIQNFYTVVNRNKEDLESFPYRTCPGKQAERHIHHYLGHAPMPLAEDLIFLRGLREPKYLMDTYNETALTLVVPSKESEAMTNFHEDFKVHIKTESPLGEVYESDYLGIYAFKELTSLYFKDRNKYDAVMDEHSNSPLILRDKISVNISFKDEPFFEKTFFSGTMDYGKAICKELPAYLDRHPELKDEILSTGKYFSLEYGSQYLFYGFERNRVNEEYYNKPLPSEKTNMERMEYHKAKPFDVKTGSRFVGRDYVNYLLNMATLKSENREDIPRNFAEELAMAGHGVKDTKTLMSYEDFNLESTEKVLNILKNDKEIKKILKNSKQKVKGEGLQ